ncbi:MAG: alpha-glucan family phosphorylase [Planctomycetota bacterium]
MDIAAELRELSGNLWWTWHTNAIALFRDLDPFLWRKVNHNPIAFLSQFPQDRLQQRASELALDARINFTFHRLNEYLSAKSTWGATYSGPLRVNPVAYFSAEFGLHESMPIFSGGLGILAGDHLKSASDLDLPLVGVGLLYAQGYFNQWLDSDGWQNESYFETEIKHLPIQRAVGKDGNPLRIRVETRSGTIAAAVWRANVGKSLLLLLDTEVMENSEADQKLTSRLYGGDEGVRIRQELILGVGGVRALAAQGIKPAVLHLNEGHSAFAILEMTRQEMKDNGIDFHEALNRVKSRTIFTTHTPVEAGHDRFDKELIESTLGPVRDELGVSEHDLMALGRVNAREDRETFCMTVLGLKASWKSNAVSALHGRVTRHMWNDLWPDRSEFQVPISHITNGVHVSSWLAPPMRQIFDTYLGSGWEQKISFPATWKPITHIDDGELWEAHQVLTARLVSFVQRQVCAQEAKRHGSMEACDLTLKRLDPNILTVGFARRFATYKRGDLILRDDKRLESLILNPTRPIQIIFAGKAHPRDEPGKHLIQRIFRMSRDPRFLGRVVFVEDYDMNVTRHLIQGVDLWLNTPRRPREACGTSGMKAVFNGVLNLSILDGWWAEAYDGSNGFAIGGGQHSDESEQDRRDTEDLYGVLEKEVIPLYYDQDARGIPRGWVARMKAAIQTLAWRFNANRMVMEYAKQCYLPSVGGFCNTPDENQGTSLV